MVKKAPGCQCERMAIIETKIDDMSANLVETKLNTKNLPAFRESIRGLKMAIGLVFAILGLFFSIVIAK